jgi:2,5-diketo-D-gluconate reductase B
MIFVDMQGTKVPALGFGTWQLSGPGCIEAVKFALKVGYRHLDTAQMYENEADVGRAIAESGVPRDELFVTTKIALNNARPPRVILSADESLRKLKLDRVDLLLLHWPVPEVPLADTLGAMMELQKSGKTRFIGVSNFPVRLMKEAVETIKAPIACNQVEYHVGLSQKPVLDYARTHKIIVTAYSPLGRSKLAGHPVLVKIGKKYGKSGAQVALRWLIEQQGVSAIPKASHEENIRQNFGIFDFKLNDEDRTAIASLGTNERLIDPAFAPEWDQAA